MFSIIENGDYYKHEMPGILEKPIRLEIIHRALEDSGILERPDVRVLPSETMDGSELLATHTQDLIDSVEHGSRMGVTELAIDTFTNEFTYRAALRAASGTRLAALLAMSQDNSIAFNLARPPGHHATCTNAGGFCFFNNVAFAANSLIAASMVKRVAIIDFDNHYGNGTASIFYGRNDVLTISLHSDPEFSFPYQGRIGETGEGQGRGYNICIPLPKGTGDRQYLQAFDIFVPPIIEDYQPELILVSAGYDGLKGDPYGYLGLSVYGYQSIGERIHALASKVCDGKMALSLEGGYKLDELGVAFMASIGPFLSNCRYSRQSNLSRLNSGGDDEALEDTMVKLRGELQAYWRLD